MKKLVFIFAIGLLLPQLSQAYILSSNSSGKVELNGKTLDVQLQIGSFTSGQMYDLAKIGATDFQVNPYASMPPMLYYLSGKATDAMVIALDLTKEDLGDSKNEAVSNQIINKVQEIKSALVSGNRESINAILPVQLENITELNCSESSNALIIVFQKDINNPGATINVSGNCARLSN